MAFSFKKLAGSKAFWFGMGSAAVLGIGGAMVPLLSRKSVKKAVKRALKL